MTSRLSPLDVSFLYLEEPTTAMHVGSTMIFQTPGEGFSYERLVKHVEARIALIPRYRQRIRWVPGRLANPVWVDDESFDIGFHVRRSALPRPGSLVQLQELVARMQARHLDRSRPLWELILVEGLQGGGFAVVTKVHQALVDGVHAVDLGHVVLDDDRHTRQQPSHPWHPAREPTSVELLVSAVADSVRRPQAIIETMRSGVEDVRATTGKVLGALGGLANAARTATRPVPHSPLNPEISAYRRFAMVATDLEDYRRIRNYGGEGPRRKRRARVSALGTAGRATVRDRAAGTSGTEGTIAAGTGTGTGTGTAEAAHRPTRPASPRRPTPGQPPARRPPARRRRRTTLRAAGAAPVPARAPDARDARAS